MSTPAADSALKSLLVHVDGGPHAETRLRLARRLAQDHGAGVTAFYAVLSTVARMPLALEAPVAAAFQMFEELDEKRRRVASSLVDRLASEPGPTIAWEECTEATPVEGLVRRAFLTDLVVLGQRDPANANPGVPSGLVESVAIGSGTPTLVLPHVDAARSIGERVVVAWKASRASAQALRAALPLLTRAREVHLVSWGDDTAQAAVAFLRRHGVEPRLDTARAAPDEPAERLLSRVADVSADLLVMGCYGHSRARELVMGGVTRTILASMTVPVLMAH